MDINFEKFDLLLDGENFNGVPFWFSNLTKFSYEICSSRNLISSSSEHFVLSLPDIDGGLAAIALGAIAAEVDRIEKISEFNEIKLNELKIGMKVLIHSGIQGQQTITGQVKSISLEDRIPRIQIGSRSIATKFIQKIFMIPSEAGNPQIFERKKNQNNEYSNFLEHLAFSSLPIHRALLDVRSTSKIIEDEFKWKFSHKTNLSVLNVEDSIRPIASGQPGSGWSLVLNTSESEELAWSNLKTDLNSSELHSDVSILCSGAAILSQLELANSKIVFSIYGRDDRQLAAAELAIKQKYEYSKELSRDINLKYLGSGVELISFEVPLNV